MKQMWFLSLLFSLMFACTVQASTHVLATPTPVQAVDVNHADITQLVTVKGLGQKKALAIIQYREKHGLYKSLDGLTEVKGIGVKTLARLEKENPGRLVVNKT